VHLPISDKAVGVINEALKISKHPDSPYIFHNREGGRRQRFTHTWYRIRKKADLPSDFRFHGLRHTFASYLASSGKVDLLRLQCLLNHQSIQMTQRYSHLLDDALRRSADAGGDIFDSVEGSEST
jgi:integrase